MCISGFVEFLTGWHSFFPSLDWIWICLPVVSLCYWMWFSLAPKLRPTIQYISITDFDHHHPSHIRHHVAFNDLHPPAATPTNNRPPSRILLHNPTHHTNHTPTIRNPSTRTTKNTTRTRTRNDTGRLSQRSIHRERSRENNEKRENIVTQTGSHKGRSRRGTE